MKIHFKNFIIDAPDLREFARCICARIKVRTDITKGTPVEIENITEAVKAILNDNHAVINKNGKQLMLLTKPVIGELIFYCAEHGYEMPKIHLFDQDEEYKTGSSFCKLLLLYIEIHYWDMIEEDKEKKDSSEKLMPAVEMEDFSFLEKKIFTSSKSTVYICSPLRGKTAETTYQNMLAARHYMLSAYRLTGNLAVAPHAYLPIILDDTIPVEREYGLLAGKKLLYRCEKLFVCGDRISEGMKWEILEAADLGMPIVTFSKEMFSKVVNIICTDDGPGCGGGVCLMIGYDELTTSSETVL